MTRQADVLPAIFGDLCHTLQYVRKHADNEYSSECSRCGGSPHKDGEWPDRLRLFNDAHPRIWCRRCSHFAWLDQIDPSAAPPTSEDLEHFRQEQIRREEERKRSAERALAILRNEEVWMTYHQQMNQRGRDWWLKRGIPREWQQTWYLGWRNDLQVSIGKGEWITCEAATLPIMDAEGQVLNVKYRLDNPPQGIGKYRYQLTGRPAPLFMANPGMPLAGNVTAIEGEIKAAVSMVTLSDPSMCIVGIPGATPGAEIVKQLQQADRVTLVMDPGAGPQLVALARQIGVGKCWGLIPPIKIDDGLIATKADSYQVHRLLQSAIKLSDYMRGA